MRPIPCAIETVAVGPGLECFLAVKEQYLDTFVLDVEVVRVGRSPLFGQGRINAASDMQDHGAWGRAICRSNKAFWRIFAVVVCHQSQSRDVSIGTTRWIARRNHVDKRHLFALAHWCCRRRVVHLYPPVRQLRLEEVQEVLAYGSISFRPRHSGDQDWRQKRAFLYIEVIARPR
jgi:hypothetical protein